MQGLNRVFLMGNVGGEPERFATDGGDPVCNFNIAVNDSWVTARGVRRESTEWFRICAYDNLGVIAYDRLRNGSLVYIEGVFRSRSYMKNGEKHFSYEIRAEKLIELKHPESKEAHDERNSEHRQRPDSYVPGHPDLRNPRRFNSGGRY
jgi:single-strand DNA-binding protein